MRHLRLFVSSPSDVAIERHRVETVVDRLNGEFDGLARIEAVRWETGFYTADRSFQEAIDAAIDRMHGTDIVVCILWKRVGSELNPNVWLRADNTPYESGTVLEVESAVAAGRRQRGVPDVFLFKKQAAVSYAAESFEVEHAQHQLLETVWRRWTTTDQGHNIAGYQRFADPDDFEIQLEQCLRQWLERNDIVLRTVWDRRIKGSPFRGLDAFGAAHAPVFFGREDAIMRAIGRLRQSEGANTPFLLMVGASGSGKSSLLQAGLMPRVARPGIIPGIDLWRTAIWSAAGDPFAGLAGALFHPAALGAELRAGDFRTPSLLAEALASGGAVALAPIRSALERAARDRAAQLGATQLGASDIDTDEPRRGRLLLAIDQIERLFVETGAAQLDAFATILRHCVDQKLATVIVALRSDGYARFQQVPAFVALIEGHGAVLNVLPPTTTELEDIVSLPVAACHPPLAFQTDARGRSLAEVLVADAEGGDALPLLQMTLQRLYEAEEGRRDGMLRAADYPGLASAVAQTASEAMATLDPAAQAQLPALLTALVGEIGLDAKGDRQPTGIAINRTRFERDLAPRRALIDAFIAARLLTAEDFAGETRVRPVHDALLRTWPEAVRIIFENAALIRVRVTLEPISADWAAAPVAAKAGHLATSSALLAGAENLLERHGDDLAPSMRDFIVASLAADQRRRAGEMRRQRRVLAATASGLAVALALAGIAGWQWHESGLQRDRAEHSLALATGAANTLVFRIAQQFRGRGLPTSTVYDVLGLARDLQNQLAASGEVTEALRFSQIGALNETATTLLTLGKTDAALDAARQSRQLMQTLLVAHPDNPFYQRNSTIAISKIGDALQAKGDLFGALAAYHESLAISAALSRAAPTDDEALRDLSIIQQKIGDIQFTQGDRTGALAAYREVLTIARDRLLHHPDEPEPHHDLSATLSRIGDALRAGGDRDGATAAYQASLDEARVFVSRQPSNTEAQTALSIAFARVGDSLQTQGNVAAALTADRESLAIAIRLAEADPANTQWQNSRVIAANKVGDLLQSQGDLGGALTAYRDGLEVRERLARQDPSNMDLQRDVATSVTRIGDVLRVQSDLPGALAAYDRALDITAALAKKDASNADWQRDLSIAYDRIADLRKQQNDPAGALAAYRAGLAIARTLANKDPGNSDWQNDLAISDNEVGDMLKAQGDLAGALASYRDGLTIAQTLARRDPSNTDWQRGLSISNDRIGDALQLQGDVAGALPYYQNSLTIRKTLVEKDPANTVWQRDLSVSDDRIGDMLEAQGDLPGALASYRDGHAIQQALSKRDPANARWQADLSASGNKIGALLQAQGDRPGALSAFRESLAIAESLAAADPSDADRLRDLSVCHERIGSVLRQAGDVQGALAEFRSEHTIHERLAKRDPANAGAQRDLSVSGNNIGDILRGTGDFDGALTLYQDDLAISLALVGKDAGNADWQRDVAVTDNRIGDTLSAKGDPDAALAAYRRSLARVTVLARASPNLMLWQQDLVFTNDRIAATLARTGDLAGAAGAYRESLALDAKLAQTYPGLPQFRQATMASYANIGFVAAQAHDLPAAREAYSQAETIALAIQQQNPANTSIKASLDWLRARLGEIPAQAPAPP